MSFPTLQLTTLLPRKIEFRSSATGTGTLLTLVISKPTGVVDGDLMLAQISQGGQFAVTPPAGWTELTGSPIDSGITLRTSIYHKVASSEGASYTWTFASNAVSVGVIAAFFGEYQLSPIDAQSVAATGSGTSHAAGTATPPRTDDLLVALYAVIADGTWTPPFTVNERADVSAGALGPSIEVGEEPLVDAAATGGRTATSTGSGVGTASLVIIRHAGEVFNQYATGSLSSAGAIVRRLNKALAGVLSSTGNIVRQSQQALAGVLTSAGALINNTPFRTLSISGALAPVGTLAKQANKTLAGTLASAGALATTFAKSFAGTIAPVGTLAKQVSKALSATLAPTGTVGRLISRSLSGTLTSIGGLAKRANKVFVGTVMSSGVLTTAKLALVVLTGTLTSAGALVKRVAQSLSGSTGPVGSLVKVLSVTMSGVLSLSGALVAGMNQAYAFVARLYARAYRMLRAHRGP